MKIRYKIATFISNLLKRILPSNLIIPILKGKLKGKKWVVASSNLECVLGTYEYKKNQLFENSISLSDVVYDVGAHAGFYTLLASELVGKNGTVVAFEPMLRNFSYLKKHVEVNNCNNVILNNVAISNFVGVSCFKEGESTYTGHLTLNSDISVKILTLDEFIRKNPEIKPNCIKIDVEGAEFDVLQGAKITIESSNPIIFLATHDENVHKKCVDFLENQDYHLEFIDNHYNELVAYKEK